MAATHPANEKYPTTVRFAKARASRAAMRAVLAPLVRWTRRPVEAEGYSVVIGCNARLGPMVDANLRMLERQDGAGLHEVLVVFDRSREEMGEDPGERLRRKHPKLPIRTLFYSPLQSRVARAMDWGWIYAWMSWCIGVEACRTRWLVLHDFDALLLDPGVLRARHERARAGDAEFIGVRHYAGGGITPADRLVVTFELMLDAAFVRENFRPIDVFNRVRRHEGRRVEFDTFLDLQSRGGRRAVLPIDEELMVHPSQMICQYVEHANGRAVPRDRHNLFMIPYYFDVGGAAEEMAAVTRGLREDGRRATLLGRTVDAGLLTPEHAAWYAKQAGRLEGCLFGGVRPHVEAYFDLIARAAGAVPVGA